MNNGSRKLWLTVLCVMSLFPVAAMAHTGVGSTSGFGAGFGHPLGGADHMLAMIAVGLWAAQQGGRSLWLVPTAFVAVMLLGGVLGMLQVGVPFVEQGILASVLVLGVLIATAMRLPAYAGASLVAVFALFHGHAHGTEMPLSGAGLSYAAGFALATALLHGAGIGLAVTLQRLNAARLARMAGAVIAFGGVYLALA